MPAAVVNRSRAAARLLQHQAGLEPMCRAVIDRFCPPAWGSGSSTAAAGCSCSSSSSRAFSSSSSSSSSSSETSSASTAGHSSRQANASEPSISISSSAVQERAWQQELRAVRAHVFEHHLGDGQRNGRKAILKPLRGRHIAGWYFSLTGPKLPMIVDDVEEERVARVELARATGGGPPKKGQGKRAKK